MRALRARRVREACCGPPPRLLVDAASLGEASDVRAFLTWFLVGRKKQKSKALLLYGSCQLPPTPCRPHLTLYRLPQPPPSLPYRTLFPYFSIAASPSRSPPCCPGFRTRLAAGPLYAAQTHVLVAAPWPQRTLELEWWDRLIRTA